MISVYNLVVALAVAVAVVAVVAIAIVFIVVVAVTVVRIVVVALCKFIRWCSTRKLLAIFNIVTIFIFISRSTLQIICETTAFGPLHLFRHSLLRRFRTVSGARVPVIQEMSSFDFSVSVLDPCHGLAKALRFQGYSPNFF